MSGRPAAAILFWLLAATAARGTDWENPVFEEAGGAVAAAVAALTAAAPEEPGPRELFALFTLSATERPHDPRFADARRREVGGFLVTLPSYLEAEPEARGMLESFLAELEDEKAGIGETLARFGFPSLRGLIYLKLVENVRELQAPDRPPAETGELIAGTTYYCRYVVLPLSYITPEELEELRAVNDPNVDVAATLRDWEQQSFRSLLATLRHELVHVWTHASLGAPRYRDPERYPTWFREGSAEFLSDQPISGRSERYQGYHDLFGYLVERHGVAPLVAFFERILAGSSVRESLNATYEIADGGELRALAERWHERNATVFASLAIAFLLLVVAALVLRRPPVFGLFQIWMAGTLAFFTFSGFCESSLATEGAAAVVILKAILGTCALVFAVRGLGRLKRALRPLAAGAGRSA